MYNFKCIGKNTQLTYSVTGKDNINYIVHALTYYDYLAISENRTVKVRLFYEDMDKVSQPYTEEQVALMQAVFDEIL